MDTFNLLKDNIMKPTNKSKTLASVMSKTTLTIIYLCKI